MSLAVRVGAERQCKNLIAEAASIEKSWIRFLALLYSVFRDFDTGSSVCGRAA
jgi:hypothetical protein